MSEGSAPLKRHPALQPFSRDHHHGLLQARRLSNSVPARPDERRRVLEGFHRAWTEELEDHFECEERWLVQLIPRDRERTRLLNDHSRLRNLARRAAEERTAEEPAPEVARDLGGTLHDHIRWEERILFPAIEEATDPEALDALAEKTAGMEARRDRRPQKS
ncbi:MAG TPA: hemerythrin domain-containing protein [Candidatus Saccharimonadales bacterium]|nr:hemerythrin domain-containing protein [Candidatus Saccharimonadales bacterium]